MRSRSHLESVLAGEFGESPPGEFVFGRGEVRSGPGTVGPPWGVGALPAGEEAQGTGTTPGTDHVGAVRSGGRPKSRTSARLRAVASLGVRGASPQRHSIIFRMEVWS